MEARVSRLLAPVSAVPYVGPERTKAFEDVGIFTVSDLLEYYPRRYLDRTHIVRIRDLQLVEHESTIVGAITFIRLMRNRRGRQWLIAGIDDGTGTLQCVWFQGVTYWQKQLRQGEQVAVSGVVGEKDGWQIIHPAVDRLGEDGDRELFNTGRIISLYHSTLQLRKVGLESATFRKIIRSAINIAKDEIDEFLSTEDLNAVGAFPRDRAIEQIHFPDSQSDLYSAWQRIRYEELFFYQLLFAYRRHFNRIAGGGIAFDHVGPLTKKVLDALPFKLTDGQREVLSEIRKDLQNPVPMQRLLQGEVGSGKTTVALMAMAMAADSGYQSAMMAPTELLASQHAQSVLKSAEAAGLTVRLLIGKLKAKEKREVLAAIANGQADIVIGTHALLAEKVEFARLGLVIIDEQHRFGVEQRTILRSKGTRPHLLLMTATPIPRTLRLSHVGDLDISTLRDMPGGARRVKTLVRTGAERNKVYKFLVEQAKAGQKIFIVCPLIDESEKVETEAAKEYYQRVSVGAFKEIKVGLLHGQMNSEEKTAALDKFRSGETPILIATPVVEVGVDMPDASIMLIENPERFGLAALHQLRGRIGRKGQAAFCVLMPGAKITPEAQARLKAIQETTDGFVIAEKDLELRGSGEFFGTRQSGEIELRFCDPVRDEALLIVARERAFNLVETDPQLKNFPLLKERFQQKHQHRLEFLTAG